MVQKSWPYTDKATSDVEYSALMSEAIDSGVAGSYGSTALQGIPAGGLKTAVRVGTAVLRGYGYNTDTNVEVTHDAASAQPRIDLVVLRLDLTKPQVDRIKPEIKKGTPALNPATPGLTQSATGIFEIPLYSARINASALSILAADITDRRVWNGGRVGRWSTLTRPNAPRRYEFGFNASLGAFEFWDGAKWTNVNDASLIVGVLPLARIPNINGERITSGVINIQRLPPIPASAIASGVLNPARLPPSRDLHYRTTGVAVGLGGTTRTVTFPSGHFADAPVVQLTLGNQTQASNMLDIAAGSVTKDSADYTIRNNSGNAQTCHVNLSAFPQS